MMNKGQLAGLMKQAQQMQDNVRKMQEQLATVEVEGQSGAGMVKVVMTCRYDVKRVSIDPSLVGDDKEMLEDLVAAAVNDALSGSVEPGITVQSRHDHVHEEQIEQDRDETHHGDPRGPAPAPARC